MPRKPNRKSKKQSRIYAMSRHYTLLGEYLQLMRKKKGLTQRDVSQELKYSSAQFISNFERGISSPPLRKLKILIELYELPPEKVMDLILKGTREVLLEALTSKTV